MKKLFVLLTATILASVCFLGGTKELAPMYAENEPQTSEPIDSSEPQETSETELEPIDIDNETEQVVSSTAKDVIEVIKTVLNQPIVVGGISTTLGAIVVWLLGKLIVNALSKRNSKYDKKIKELLEKIGINEQALNDLIATKDKLEQIIKVIIDNTKNVKVKEQLLGIWNDSSKSVIEKAQEIAEQTSEQIESSTQNAIEELLKK